MRLHTHSLTMVGLVELTRKQLESVLVAHHRIQPEKQATFRSRIKTLQRMGFPPGTNVGRGPKVDYSADHLLMLVAVFELHQIGLPADRAIKSVLAGWDGLKVGFGVAFQLQDQFTPSDEKVLGWIQGRALRDMQFEPRPPMQHAGIPFATAITSSAFTQMLQKASAKRMSYSYLVLDLSDIIRSVVAACANAAGLDDVELGLELHRWAEHGGGYIQGGNPLHPKDDEWDDEI